jgi:hypothetical protein
MIQVAVEASNLAIHKVENNTGPGFSPTILPDHCGLLLSYALDFIFHRSDRNLLFLGYSIQHMYKLVQFLVHYGQLKKKTQEG